MKRSTYFSAILEEEYSATPIKEFCKKYQISTKTARKAFGLRQADARRASGHSKETIQELSALTGLTTATVEALTNYYGITEIRQGRWINGEFQPKNLWEYRKN